MGQELDRPTAECEACLGKDTGSIEDHLARCPKCVERDEKANQHSKAHDMAMSLISMPSRTGRSSWRWSTPS